VDDNAAPPVIHGLELARRFYWDAVAPLLQEHFRGLSYSAGLIGSGSEVLGFDTEMSTDHHWGPRVMLFVSDDGWQGVTSAISEMLRRTLPRTFMGYPTSFTPPDPADHGTQLLALTAEGPINHRVAVLPLHGYFRDYLGTDVRGPLTPADWLTLPEQKLLAVTAGDVFHDETGLAAIRKRLAYYPRDVWLYLLAAGWTRIGQEEHLMGRAGHSGDEIGSAVIGARLVRDVMRLCFLMERRYAPYPKWLGTAFMRLQSGPDLAPTLRQALQADTWQQRGELLAAAYRYCARRHNALGLTEPLPDEPSLFFGRPFPVIWGERFATALVSAITDAEVRRIAARGLIGAVDQISDNTDLLAEPAWRPALRELYTDEGRLATRSSGGNHV
jgi:hypothetical protein